MVLFEEQCLCNKNIAIAKHAAAIVDDTIIVAGGVVFQTGALYSAECYSIRDYPVYLNYFDQHTAASGMRACTACEQTTPVI